MGVAEGDMAPDFSLPATGGRVASLANMKGKPFILYFYPKADTPGCTKEACAFQEATPKLEEIGLAIVGVSPDKIKPIEKFAAKYGLTFPLVSRHSGFDRLSFPGIQPGQIGAIEQDRDTSGNAWFA